MLDLFFTEEEWKKIFSRKSFLEKELSREHLDFNSRKDFQKEYSLLSFSYDLYAQIILIEKQLEELKNQESSSDEELKELIKSEISNLEIIQKHKIDELELGIFPGDSSSARSVFIEIRAGTGGLEASLFAGDLARMYSSYSIKKGWSATISSISETDVGGIREIVLHIDGKNAFELFRHESGVHRVQRVPSTETAGRIHTSTATVAVLPEAEDVEIVIDPTDLRVDTYRASGAGGQHVNKTDSAIRITHIPSGTVVSCQVDRSQHKNRATAMKQLKSKLLMNEKEKNDKKMGELRKEMSGSAERSDKVRTYNFPQNRVTDHQVELTLNKLEYILQGDLDEIIDALLKKGIKGRQKNILFSTVLVS